MGQEEQVSPFRRYDLCDARVRRSTRTPAAHQDEALGKLRAWYDRPRGVTGEHHGAVLALPTGAGKTFTAVRFLCERPLTDGRRVLWLAHTHHLLEQAFNTFGPAAGVNGHVEVGHVGGGRRALSVRLVSGAPGHHRPRHIESEDHVLVGTLQTFYNAQQRGQPHWKKFLQRARKDGLFVVFDEAHHAPANTYRRLVEALREQVPECSVLGLTATPDYADPRRVGWLSSLFPQAVIHRADFHALVAAGVLSRPRFMQVQTSVAPRLPPRVSQDLRMRFGDLPDEIVDLLATNDGRNALIAKTWLDRREEFGPTIIFTDRWVQCEAIRAHLERGKAKVGVVYHHTAPQSAGGRALAQEANARALREFRAGKLDVLVNIRMLTEGTDVPNARTVFLTRQTTSRILLTQMIGRALRGPRFGGTPDAHVVSFIDDWEIGLPWAEWPWPEGETSDTKNDTTRRLIALLSISLVRQFVDALESPNVLALSAQSWLPVGWYEVAYSATDEGVAESTDADDATAEVTRFVLVFEGEREPFERLLAAAAKADLSEFEATTLDHAQACRLADAYVSRFFPKTSRPGDSVRDDAAHVLRHVAQRGVAPPYHPAELRESHDLGAIADRFINDDLGPRRQREESVREYERADRYWRGLFRDLDLFDRAVQATIRLRLRPSRGSVDPPPPPPPGPGDRDVTAEVAAAVLRRYPRCLACGGDRRLQIDHVKAVYYGGSSEIENLQTLCSRCNRRKSMDEIDFRLHTPQKTLLATWRAEPGMYLLDDASAWERFARRELNFYFACASVRALELGVDDELLSTWIVTLHRGVPLDGAEVPLRASLAAGREVLPKGWKLPTRVVVTDSTREHIFSTRRARS